MITTHNIDPGCCLHPSARGCPFYIPTANASGLVVAAPESGFVVGTPLNLSASGSMGPGGYIPGSPLAIAMTVGIGTHGSTYRILGVNQFNKQVTEIVAPTIVGVTWTQHAYKQIISITPITVVSSTSTLGFGYFYGNGNRIGLPFRPANALQVANGIQAWQQRVEVVGYMNPSTNTFLALGAPGISEQYATLTFGAALIAGAGWLVTNYINKGFRER